jgi:hypothetical protein
MNEQAAVMPAFIFGRQRNIEIEGNFTLAGVLVTPFPKGKEPKKREKKAIKLVIDELLRAAQEGSLGDVTNIWADKAKHPNAIETPIPDDVMERWMSTHFVVIVRVDPRHPSAGMTIDSDLARRIERNGFH